ncbi:unnamed protein product [Soboliphyme baturini]|uniref:ESCRT-II complex subunit VPS22 n=1 Tax=Soboliphyme baturini TaxID=241478 RepID=A0A183JA24_9BILA|nr:unnamed protein product [Soboliphyme baturini]
MKLMQTSFLLITKIMVYMNLIPADFSSGFESPTRDSALEMEAPTEEHVQELLEHAFPNGLKLEIIANTFRCTEDQILEFLTQLKEKGLVKCLESGHWVRIDRAAEFGTSFLPKSIDLTDALLH